MVGLRETVAGVWAPLQYASQADRLQGRIQSAYLQAYNQSGRAMAAHLGAEGRFQLQAAWKQREIAAYAQRMALNLQATNAERRQRLDAWLQAELAKGKRSASEVRADAAAQWARWLQYKQNQMEGILRGRALLEAQTDILVHSGLVDARKDRVIYFGGSPAPCPFCEQIAAGNPYTVEEARGIGGVAHPNCRDVWWSEASAEPTRWRWPTQWRVADAQLDVARQKVRDGSVRLWLGQSRTPARGQAATKEARMRGKTWRQIPGYVAKVQSKRA